MALLAVLGLGAVLRLHGIGFGLPALNDSDELMFELGAARMLTGLSLNPGWFGHPATVTMYVLALVNATTFAFGWLLGFFPNPNRFIAAIYADPSIMILPGRIAMACFGLVTVWQAARMARTVAVAGTSGHLAGLFAALILACSTLHVNYSQVIRSDMLGTVFMMMTIGFAMRIARDGRAADYHWAALGVALSVACKWPFGIVAVAVMGAMLVRLAHDRTEATILGRRLLVFLLLVPVLLIVISPYLILDYPTVLRNLGGEAQTKHLGATSEGFWLNLWWYLSGALREALGLPGLVLAGAGLALLARNRNVGWVIMPVLFVYVPLICLHGLRWERWVLPMLPLLSVAAGIAAATCVQVIGKRWRPAYVNTVTALSACALCVSLAVPAWIDASARANDTRQVATRWAREHLPPGSTVMIEHLAFDLFDTPWTILYPLGDVGCVDAKAMLAGRINYKAIDAARGSRANIDYGTVAPARRETCRADYVILMEMERYRAERDLFPQEYAAYELLKRDMDVRKIVRPEPGRSSGPVMTIMGWKTDTRAAVDATLTPPLRKALP